MGKTNRGLGEPARSEYTDTSYDMLICKHKHTVTGRLSEYFFHILGNLHIYVSIFFPSTQRTRDKGEGQLFVRSCS